MPSEVESRATFEDIRYAQVWEDADVLLDGLDIQPGDRCVSIASAGDNALALLARNPSHVVAVDLSAAQLACLELRVAAYRMLEHSQVLVLMGSRPERTPGERLALYRHCAPLLGESTRTFWDMRHDRIPEGIGSLGKFERYFRLFRRWVVPLIHGKRHVAELLAGGTRAARETFYQAQWDTWRWRLLFQIFFSRAAMGRLGRDPAFFRYVEGSVADRILERTRHAFVELNPADNPYLHWIFTGTHGDALPFVLRPENFESIRTNLDRLVLRHGALEDVLDELGPHSVDRFNLSDIFEYMNEEASERLLSHLALTGRQGGRLAYWNMLAPRSRPQSLADRLRPLETRAQELWMRDRAFFYSAFRLEEVL